MGLWIPKETFSVTFKLDGIDLGRYSTPTVAASFFLCFLMAERFAFSVFQDIVSLLTPVTSCSFLWGMEGEKKKFKSAPKRVKAMLCTSLYPANPRTFILELIPLSHAPPGGKRSHQNHSPEAHRGCSADMYFQRPSVTTLALPSPTFASNELSATRASTSISSSLTRRNGEDGCWERKRDTVSTYKHTIFL